MANLSRRAGSEEQIGDVKQSVLTEAQFQSLHGTTWVLMRGQSITGSSLATEFGLATLPDARGVFIRGKNNGRADGNQNPDGDVALGTVQADGFGSHNHGGGNHNHQAGTGTWDTNANVDAANRFPDFANSGPSPNSFVQNSGTIISTEGANETRMKNITANIFVKING